MIYIKEEMDSLLEFLERLQPYYFESGCMSQDKMPPELFSWLLGFSDGTEEISVCNFNVQPGINTRIIHLGSYRAYSIVYASENINKEVG